MKAKILWIEGKRAASPSLIPGLRRKGYSVDIVATGTQALHYLTDNRPNLIVVHAASMRSNGRRNCRTLRNTCPNLPIIVITSLEFPLEGDSCANVVLELPFTTRKLINRMKPLLPTNDENLLSAGPINLDVHNRMVSCNGHEERLTPRLVSLLKMLIEHRGEVVQREILFKSVWDTGYTGDTRTLDVHISWLRQAIEENPRQPALLKTIRGLGYRLDA